MPAGTLPMVAGRIEHYAALPAFKDKVPNGFEHEVKRLYYEIANSAHKPALAALTNMVPTSQIMFGTDFPLVAIDDTANGLKTLGFAAGRCAGDRAQQCAWPVSAVEGLECRGSFTWRVAWSRMGQPVPQPLCGASALTSRKGGIHVRRS